MTIAVGTAISLIGFAFTVTWNASKLVSAVQQQGERVKQQGEQLVRHGNQLVGLEKMIAAQNAGLDQTLTARDAALQRTLAARDVEIIDSLKAIRAAVGGKEKPPRQDKGGSPVRRPE
jgi:hypothetical protein